jgi:hypothetical protein
MGNGARAPANGAFAVIEFQLPLPAVVTVAARPVDAPRKPAISANSSDVFFIKSYGVNNLLN